MLKDVTHRSQGVTCHSAGQVGSRYCPQDRRKVAEGEADRQTDLVPLPFHSALVQISSEKNYFEFSFSVVRFLCCKNVYWQMSVVKSRLFSEINQSGMSFQSLKTALKSDIA